MVEIEKCKPGESGVTLSWKNRSEKQNAPCIYGGVEYKSQTVLALKLGVSRTTISRAMVAGEYKGVKLESVK